VNAVPRIRRSRLGGKFVFAFAAVMILSIASAVTALYAFENVASSNRLGSELALTLATVTSEISRHSDIIIALTQQAPTLESPASILAAKQAAIEELAAIHALADRLEASLPLPAARQKLILAEDEYRDDVEVLFDQLIVHESLQGRRFQSISNSRHAVTVALDQLAGISSRHSLDFNALIETSEIDGAVSRAAGSLRTLLQVKDIVARLQSIEAALVIVRTAASAETLGSAQQTMALDVRSLLRETRQILDAATGEALREVAREI